MKKIGRKVFFGSLGSGVLGILLLKNTGFNVTNIFSRKKKIKIQENPLAVKREVNGKSNGR